MKFKIISFLIIICAIISCCSSNPQKAEDKRLSIVNYQQHFKYKNLQSFNVDSLNWLESTKQFKLITSEMYPVIWKGGERNFRENGLVKDYFYSWQERNSDFIEFVILTFDESDYCITTTYYIFNNEGALIDSFMASARCADGGWSFDSKGDFITKTMYKQVNIEMEITDYDSVTNLETYEGDSTSISFEILQDGRVKKQTEAKREFVKIF